MAKRIREKAEKIRENKDNRPYASVRYVRLSPTKAKIVIDTIKGKGYDDAVAILSNMPNEAASILLKVVKSAGANAENNKGLNSHEMYIADVVLGSGPVRANKLYARGKGGMNRIATRTSHIKVVLDIKE